MVKTEVKFLKQRLQLWIFWNSWYFECPLIVSLSKKFGPWSKMPHVKIAEFCLSQTIESPVNLVTP